MSITPDDMKAIALAIAVANGHPAPVEYADKAVTAFTGEPVAQETLKVTDTAAIEKAIETAMNEIGNPVPQQ